jgi:hypothetical protein
MEVPRNTHPSGEGLSLLARYEADGILQCTFELIDKLLELSICRFGGHIPGEGEGDE